MITDKQSEGYKLAERMAAEYTKNGKVAAQKMYDDYLASHTLFYWETAVIVDTFRELAGLI